MHENTRCYYYEKGLKQYNLGTCKWRGREDVRLRSGGLGGRSSSSSLGLLLVLQAFGLVVDGGNLLLDLGGNTGDLLARGGLKSLFREKVCVRERKKVSR